MVLANATYAHKFLHKKGSASFVFHSISRSTPVVPVNIPGLCGVNQGGKSYEERCNKKRQAGHIQPASFALLLREHILAHAAQRALEILGDILPLGAGGNAVVRIAQGLVILVAANIADIFHGSFAPFFSVAGTVMLPLS